MTGGCELEDPGPAGTGWISLLTLPFQPSIEDPDPVGTVDCRLSTVNLLRAAPPRSQINASARPKSFRCNTYEPPRYVLQTKDLQQS